MYCEDISFLVNKYKKPCPENLSGYTHNNRQLAFGNTIQAIIDGANMIDAVYGIEETGNCYWNL